MQLGYHSNLKESFNQVTLIDRARRARGYAEISFVSLKSPLSRRIVHVICIIDQMSLKLLGNSAQPDVEVGIILIFGFGKELRFRVGPGLCLKSSVLLSMGTKNVKKSRRQVYISVLVKQIENRISEGLQGDELR